MWTRVLAKVLLVAAPFMASAAGAGGIQAPAAPGDAKALIARGDAYLVGPVERRDCRKAIECYRQAAAKDSDALMRLGGLYVRGSDSMKPDSAAALESFEQAAAAGVVEAPGMLAKMYSDGFGTAANQEKAFQWFLRAADKGDDDARLEVALRSCMGNGTRPDPALCLKYSRLLNESTHDEKLKTLSALLAAHSLALQGKPDEAFKALGKTGVVLLLGILYVVAVAGMGAFTAVYLLVGWRKRRKYMEGDLVSPGVVDALAGFFVFIALSALLGFFMVFDARLELLLAGLGGVASVLFWGAVFRARGQRTRQVVSVSPLTINKTWRHLLLALCLIFVFGMLYQLVVEAFGVSLDNQFIVALLPKPGASAAAVIGALLCGGLLIPYCEEFVFRGIVYRGLAAKTPCWVAAVVSSSLFALLHMQLKFMLPIFVVGMVMCWAYRKFGSLLAPVAIHSLNNIIALSLIMAGL